MNSSTTMVAQKSLQRADPQFFGAPTEELLLDVSWIRQTRLDTLDAPRLEESTRRRTLDYLEYRAGPIILELKRRYEQHQRHAGDPLVSQWPSAERYEKTLELARELKHSIPLSVYVHYAVPGVNLQRQGNRWRGHCPYPNHRDSSPSFVIFDERRFTCFGCDRSGDIFALVALVDNVERFTDQVRSLAIWAGKAVQE